MKLAACLAALLLWAGPTLAAPQFTTIYSFLDGKDGSVPAAVTAAPDGALYGTTSGGGTQDDGTVFKLSSPAIPGAAWTKETLHIFKPNESGRPYARVIFDQDTGALLGLAPIAMGLSGRAYGPHTDIHENLRIRGESAPPSCDIQSPPSGNCRHSQGRSRIGPLDEIECASEAGHVRSTMR